MDRKSILGVVVAIIVLAAWSVHNQREMAKYRVAKQAYDAEVAARQAAAAPVGVDPSTVPAPAGVAPDTLPSTGTAAAEPPVAEQKETLSSPSVDYVFTNQGGGIARAILLKHVAQQGTQQAGEDGTKVTLNEYGAVPIGAVSEQPGEAAPAAFAASFNKEAGEATFERTDARQLQVVKKFTLPKSTELTQEYLVGLDLAFTNRSAQPIVLPAYYVHAGGAGPIHRLDQPIYTGFSWYHDGKFTLKGVTTFSSGWMFNRTEQPIFTQSLNGVRWAGVTNQYFSTLVTPAEGATGSAIWARKFSSGAPGQVGSVSRGNSPAQGQLLAVEGALGMAGCTLAPGQTVSQRFSIYAGPREYRRLDALGQEQDAIMDFGMFKVISKALLVSMNWLHAHLGSYAAAIIVLTLLIRSAMWPLQNKATTSMKKMAALQPRMTELREKYPDDPQRMNQELMKLYKQYQINPLSGCLPMVVQIPIFFGLFNMLGKAVELRNSQFLWVHDLSQPDTVAMIGGIPLNILPMVMAGTMFLQMSLSPKSGDAVQQRIFMFMPLIFVFFCYNYASALALYWSVQNLFSIVQLYVTRDNTPILQKMAALAPIKRKNR